MYHGTMPKQLAVPKQRSRAADGGLQRLKVERVQTGVRLEKRLLMVLRALADAKGVSLGDLIEGIVLHAFEGKAPFSRATLGQVAALKQVFRLDLSAADSHSLTDRKPGRGSQARAGGRQ